ncbi:FimV/HubP family polar landmark protein [Halopseudomonas maritima]|uniref:FimV/HubP family polar landmark protein n=1 Tax=Halopseudomonas maritima TaxID=2918528 RepID=UPI001EEC6615|nr:FimV/HubP family polar landmark protein [Halopseudomonas maritima]UJJ31927.1 peptigoglycan-binding protein LysM [Halopseudomonas maritima]
MVRKLVIAVAAASAVMSSGMVHALGVGDIHLQSSLNQPLQAEIDLVQVRDLSSDEIRTVLASPDEFGRAGIERPFFLTDLKFQPIVKPNGRSVIRVTSNRPVSEPFLNFLMEVRWPSGKVLREFTVLLDPPLYQPTPVISSSSVRAPSSSGAMPAPRVAPARPSAAGLASAAAVSAPATQSTASRTPAPASDGQVRTGRSDTLWDLALRNRPQGASVHQTMLAIQDLNPGAFSNGNINQLKAGQTLTMPSAEQASRRSNSEAVAEVAAQNRAWREGRAPAAAEASAPQLDARPRESAGAAPEAVNTEDSLRLVSGADDNAADGGGDAAAGNAAEDAQLRDALDRAKEQLDSAEREKAELNDRLGDVQGQVETLQRLLELKDAQLAALQEQVADGGDNTELTPEPQADLQDIVDSEEQAAALDAIAAELDSDAAADAAQDLAEADAAETAAELEQGDALGEEQVATEAEADISETPVVAPVTEAPAEPEQAEPQQPATPAEPVAAPKDPASVLQGLMQNQMVLIGGGVVAILLLLLVLMSLSRRNARREAEMADNFIANAADDKSDLDAQEADDFNVALAGIEDGDQDDLSLAADPLVEADALLAYGKPQEARDVLVDAIAADSERSDLRLKLMEVEGLLENAESYREQRAVLEAQGNQADRIAELDARFPLMAAAAAGVAAVVLEDDDELLLSPEPSAEPAPVEEDMDFDFSEFDLGDDASGSEAAVPLEDVLAEAPVEQPAEESTSSDDGFDLDFDLDEPAAETTVTEPVEPEPLTSGSADEFDLSDFELDTDSLDLPESPEAPQGAALDSDFDLSMTEELEADNLIAEFEAMDEPAKVDSEPAAEQSLALSDTELASLDAELSPTDALDDLEFPAADESSEELDAFELPELSDADLTPIDSATEEAVGDSLDEDDEFDFLSGTDECATKLDLARAYIDMGDQEGARDILNEVVEEGTEQQQQEARSMMERLTD